MDCSGKTAINSSKRCLTTITCIKHKHQQVPIEPAIGDARRSTSQLAPIVLFVHRRPEHTRRTLAALRANQLAGKSDLIIYADAARSETDHAAVAQVRDIIRDVSGFRRVHCYLADQNLGLAASIIGGVNAVMANYDRVIVVEDDMLTSPYFLHFMNKALRSYCGDQRIFSITGYGYPPALLQIPYDYSAAVYLSHRGGSWGWATWRDRWQSVDWAVSDYHDFSCDKDAQRTFNRGGADLTAMLHAQMRGDINSWAIRWAYARFRRGAWALVPVHSYVQSIGHDGSGTHCGNDPRFANHTMAAVENPELPAALQPDERILEGVRHIHRESFRRRIRACYRQFFQRR